MKNRKKKLTILLLCVALLCVLAIGGTLAFFTDSGEVTNTFSLADLDIAIEEPHWDVGTPDNPLTPEDESEPGDGDNLTPGDTKVKDPTTAAVVNDCYMRMIVTVLDNNPVVANPNYTAGSGEEEYISNPNFGKPITDEERLNLIMQTVRFDPSYDADAKPVTSGINPAYSYELDELVKFATVNPEFTLDISRTGSGLYYYNYNEILKQGEKVVLFTNVVIPTDWDTPELEFMGKYQIVVEAQGIQIDTFNNSGEAFAALDGEILNNTMQKNYGE